MASFRQLQPLDCHVKGAVRWYCLRMPICNLSTCFITQMYKINEHVRYHNEGTMEGLREARLKKQCRLSIYGIE